MTDTSLYHESAIVVGYRGSTNIENCTIRRMSH